MSTLDTEPGPASVETPARRRRFGGKFLLVSLAVHVVLGVGAAYLVVQSFQKKPKQDFTAPAQGPNPSSRALEHQVQAKKTSALSAPPAMKRVTTSGLSKVSLPSLPAMPDLSARAVPSLVSGMGTIGLAPGSFGNGGGGNGTGNGGGNGTGGPTSFFGMRVSGKGLEGTFYDLKQTPGRQPTKMSPGEYGNIVINFAKGGFNMGALSKFFKSDVPLYATQVFTPEISADKGPAAYGLEKIVQPSLWVVLYKGYVVAPETGTFHFVGAGDDVLIVKFGSRVVLDSCWYINLGLKAAGSYHYDFNAGDRGFVKGEGVHVEAGQTYPVEILIGEQPGNGCSAALLIEKEGVTYEKEAHGSPLLPIFRVSDAPLPPSPTRYCPHSEGGPIWKTVPKPL